jgi:hypothetical protein
MAATAPTDAIRYDAARIIALGLDAPVRVGNAVRGPSDETPGAIALAPDHVGLTREASPTLYWALSARSTQRVEVVLADDRAIDPLLDVAIEPPIEVGTHAIDLARYGVHLSEGVTYSWFVSLVPDPEHHSKDIVFAAAIRRIPPDAKLDAELAAAPPERRAHVLAAAGLWYDALMEVSNQLAASTDARGWRGHRAELLRQAGVAQAEP